MPEINLTSSLTRDQDGATIIGLKLIRMSRTSANGDSGGPVYNGSTAYGIVEGVANSTGKMIYSPIRDVAQDLIVTICTTASC